MDNDGFSDGGGLGTGRLRGHRHLNDTCWVCASIVAHVARPCGGPQVLSRGVQEKPQLPCYLGPPGANQGPQQRLKCAPQCEQDCSATMNEREWTLIRDEWRSRLVAEYTSAALSSRLAHWSIACGLPRPIQSALLRTSGDELEHAESCSSILRMLGDVAFCPDLDFGRLNVEMPEEGPIAGLVDYGLSAFCFGETLAVPLFSAMLAGAREPGVRSVLTRILQDEAFHRQTAWLLLDSLLEVDAAGVRHRSIARIPGLVRGFDQAYGQVLDLSPEPDPEIFEWGLLMPSAYRRIFAECLENDLRPRFERRGLWPMVRLG